MRRKRSGRVLHCCRTPVEERDAANWRLLRQMDLTDYRVGMAYFVMHRADLAARDFARVGRAWLATTPSGGSRVASPKRLSHNSTLP